MDALSLEPFAPAAALSVGRTALGDTDPARLTTSDEQRAEALEHAAELMVKAHATRATLEVRWTRGEPTVLTIAGHFETLPTPRGDVAVFAPDEVTEHTRGGVPILHDEAVRLRTLRAELADMRAHNAGPA